MAKSGAVAKKSPKNSPKPNGQGSTTSRLAKRGVKSSEDFRDLMSALMTDVIQGAINPDIANAACNAGRNLLRIVELEYKFSANRRTAGSAGFPVSRRIGSVASA